MRKVSKLYPTHSFSHLDWSASFKKIQAREDTIIHVYRTLTGMRQIPPDQQYWTMCGLNVNADGSPREKGEYYHMYNSGIIQSPDQFFGVERELDWHRLNTRIHGPKWLHGDFRQNMETFLFKGQFRPAIVNMDGVQMPEKGVSYFASILSLLTNEGVRNVIVIGNFVLKCYYRKVTYQVVADELCQNRLFAQIFGEWNLYRKIYVYKGANDRFDQTEMGTVVLWR